jgi:hypothetical protein
MDSPIRSMKVNTSEKTDIRSVFSKNRAEELGRDVWEDFVVPRFYDKLDIGSSRKPQAFIGGRGCGKTMLLRYLSHQTVFSLNRPEISTDTASNIGLYWRADTQFASGMSGRGVEKDVWDEAFRHLIALVLSQEILLSLKSVAASACDAIGQQDLERLSFSSLDAFDPMIPHDYEAFREYLKRKLWSFESWVSNVRRVEAPHFLPGNNFLTALIETIRDQLQSLNSSIFFVYIDEYENLGQQQKKILNTWLKHSEEPLIFNLAMKRGPFVGSTIGMESLANIHDLRIHDLESLLDQEFDVFAAEILFHRLVLNEIIPESPVPSGLLQNPDKLALRRNDDYKRGVVMSALRLFPDVPERQLADGVFEDGPIRKKLEKSIAAALRRRKSDIDPGALIDQRFSRASIIIPALLSRSTLSPETVGEEFQKHRDGLDSRFDDWVHNNFIGALLQLYEPFSRACPFYAGFRTFCHLSRRNLRHFIELIHKSISHSSADLGSVQWPLSQQEQAEAAREASAAFLREVKSFGNNGAKLHTFVLRLGTLFKCAQQRPSLSEAEQSHFSIGRSIGGLSTEDLEFLDEAVKWSVLFAEHETKTKEKYSPEESEYVLNPIYAPFFHISYRKRKKLEIPASDLVVLMNGSLDEVSELLRRYSIAWGVEPTDIAPTLFSGLQEV